MSNETSKQPFAVEGGAPGAGKSRISERIQKLYEHPGSNAPRIPYVLAEGSGVTPQEWKPPLVAPDQDETATPTPPFEVDDEFKIKFLKSLRATLHNQLNQDEIMGPISPEPEEPQGRYAPKRDSLQEL
jgi:hypothetical protein